MVDALQSLFGSTNPGFLLILAGLIAYVARHSIARGIVTIGGPLLGLVALIFHQAQGIPLSTVDFMDLTLVLYQVERVSIVFGTAFLIAALIHSIYALHEEDPVQDAASLVFAGAATSAVFAGDLMVLFIFWEIATLAAALLIFRAGTDDAYKAALRFLGIQILGGIFLLEGVIFMLKDYGDVGFRVLEIEGKGAWFLLLGIGVKAAFPVVHTWFQDTVSKATVTGAITLSIFTTMLAVYALLRVFPGADLLIAIGAVMAIFPVVIAVLVDDLRRVMAYVVTAQLGLMICGIGVGSDLALNGVTAYAFCHIFFTILIFMVLGIVKRRTGTTNASELGGLYRTMPVTTGFCLVAVLSVIGMPLFSGFVGQAMILNAIAGNADIWVWGAMLVSAAAIAFLAGVRVPVSTFFGADAGKRPEDAPFNMVLAMGIAAATCVWVGVPVLGGTGFLFEFLPSEVAASSYLERGLWTSGNVLTQLQLISFAVVAFALMSFFGRAPKTHSGTVLDVDWVWRKPGFETVVWLGAVYSKIGPATTSALKSLSRKVYDSIENTFSPQGELSRGPLSSGMAVWTSVMLAVVLILSLVSGV